MALRNSGSASLRRPRLHRRILVAEVGILCKPFCEATMVRPCANCIDRLGGHLSSSFGAGCVINCALLRQAAVWPLAATPVDKLFAGLMSVTLRSLSALPEAAPGRGDRDLDAELVALVRLALCQALDLR